MLTNKKNSWNSLHEFDRFNERKRKLSHASNVLWVRGFDYKENDWYTIYIYLFYVLIEFYFPLCTYSVRIMLYKIPWKIIIIIIIGLACSNNVSFRFIDLTRSNEIAFTRLTRNNTASNNGRKAIFQRSLSFIFTLYFFAFLGYANPFYGVNCVKYTVLNTRWGKRVNCVYYCATNKARTNIKCCLHGQIYNIHTILYVFY